MRTPPPGASSHAITPQEAKKWIDRESQARVEAISVLEGLTQRGVRCSRAPRTEALIALLDELRVEDVAGNKARLVMGRDEGPHWHIVLPIVAGVAAITVIILIFITVCVCRNKYSPVNTQYV